MIRVNLLPQRKAKRSFSSVVSAADGPSTAPLFVGLGVLVLAGGSSKVASLHRAIERRSRLPLEVADAWKRVEIDPSLDRTYLAAHSPEALIGVGLAMRAQGDN